MKKYFLTLEKTDQKWILYNIKSREAEDQKIF